MRALLFTLIALLLLTPQATAQNQQRLFGYYFGMTEAQARALTPSVSWNQAPSEAFSEEGRTAIATSDYALSLGGVQFRIGLEFIRNRLDRVTLMTGGPVSSADECNRVLFSVITELEEALVPFNGAPMNEEQLQDYIVERTVRGGEVRVYGHPLIGVLGYANARNGYFAEARSIYQITPWPGLDGAPPCMIVVRFEPTAPSVRPRRQAQPAPDDALFDSAALVETPEWVETPQWYVIGSAMPRIAGEASIPGSAVLDCLVQADYSLRCRVESEEPTGIGFGEAARLVAEHYRITPRIDGADTVGMRVRLPINFGPTNPAN